MPLPLMDEIAAIKIALVGLPEETGAKFPAQLSGGMRKRPGWPAPWRSTRRSSFLTSLPPGSTRSRPPILMG